MNSHTFGCLTKPSGNLIRKHSRRRTTSSTRASLGRHEKDKGYGLSRDDSCPKAQCRWNSDVNCYSYLSCLPDQDAHARSSRCMHPVTHSHLSSSPA